MFWLIALAAIGADYRWTDTNQPDQRALWDGRTQIGAYNLVTREYLALSRGKFVPGNCPCPLPEEAGFVPETAPGDVPNYGLDWQPTPGKEQYLVNGEEVSKETAAGLVEGKEPAEALKDDSRFYRLTIVGGADRTAAVKRIRADPAARDMLANTLVKDYPPEHWAIRGKGYTTSGDRVHYFLTTHAGELLFAGPDYEAIFPAWRRHQNPLAIDLNWWQASGGFFGAIASFAMGKVHIPAEFFVAIITAVVIGILLIKRQKGAPS